MDTFYHMYLCPLTWWESEPGRRCHTAPRTVSAAQGAQTLPSSHFQSWHSPCSPDLCEAIHFDHLHWNLIYKYKCADEHQSYEIKLLDYLKTDTLKNKGKRDLMALIFSCKLVLFRVFIYF